MKRSKFACLLGITVITCSIMSTAASKTNASATNTGFAKADKIQTGNLQSVSGTALPPTITATPETPALAGALAVGAVALYRWAKGVFLPNYQPEEPTLQQQEEQQNAQLSALD